MSDIQESITAWIQQLKSGDAEAAQRLWENYFSRMVELARRKLSGTSRTVADEEDVALSAFNSFCLRAREGLFTSLTDRENLWPLLMVMTQNKSVDLIRHQNRRRRGGTGDASADADSHRRPVNEMADQLSDLLSREPNPEFAALMADELQQQLLQLDSTGDPDLRKIAILKLEGCSTPEIATSIGCVRRSVERKLQVISAIWTANLESNDST